MYIYITFARRGGGFVLSPSEAESSTGIVDREEVGGLEPRADGNVLDGRTAQARDAAAEVDEVRAYGVGASAGGVELEDAGAVEAGGGELRLCRDAAEAGRVSAVYNGGHYRQAARRGDLAVDHAVPGHPRGEVRGVALLRLNVLL
jgi:hypothetical protein